MKHKLFSILSSLVLVLNVFGLIPHSDQSVNALTFNLVDLAADLDDWLGRHRSQIQAASRSPISTMME